MRLRGFPLMLLATWMALTALPVCAQDGLRGAQLRLARTAGFLQELFAQRLVAADFDNDQRPDGAVLVDSSRMDGQKTFRIELHVTARENVALNFGSDESELAISVLDVNLDGAPDLVLRQAITQKVLQVWMNDGRGSFRLATARELGLALGEAPCRISAHSPIQECPAFSLSARSGSEIANLKGGSFSLPFPASQRRAQLQCEFVESAAVDAIPIRGPPRPFAL